MRNKVEWGDLKVRYQFAESLTLVSRYRLLVEAIMYQAGYMLDPI